MLVNDMQTALDTITATLGDSTPGVAVPYLEHILNNLVAVTDDYGNVIGYDTDMALYFAYLNKAEQLAAGGGIASFTSEGSSVTRQTADPTFFERLALQYRDRALNGGGSSISVAAVAESPVAGWAGYSVQYDRYQDYQETRAVIDGERASDRNGY